MRKIHPAIALRFLVEYEDSNSFFALDSIGFFLSLSVSLFIDYMDTALLGRTWEFRLII